MISTQRALDHFRTRLKLMNLPADKLVHRFLANEENGPDFETDGVDVLVGILAVEPSTNEIGDFQKAIVKAAEAIVSHSLVLLNRIYSDVEVDRVSDAECQMLDTIIALCDTIVSAHSPIAFGELERVVNLLVVFPQTYPEKNPVLSNAIFSAYSRYKPNDVELWKDLLSSPIFAGFAFHKLLEHDADDKHIPEILCMLWSKHLEDKRWSGLNLIFPTWRFFLRSLNAYVRWIELLKINNMIDDVKQTLEKNNSEMAKFIVQKIGNTDIAGTPEERFLRKLNSSDNTTDDIKQKIENMEISYQRVFYNSPETCMKWLWLLKNNSMNINAKETPDKNGLGMAEYTIQEIGYMEGIETPEERFLRKLNSSYGIIDDMKHKIEGMKISDSPDDGDRDRPNFASPTRHVLMHPAKAYVEKCLLQNIAPMNLSIRPSPLADSYLTLTSPNIYSERLPRLFENVGASSLITSWGVHPYKKYFLFTKLQETDNQAAHVFEIHERGTKSI